jgi:type III restriction enzyme
MREKMGLAAKKSKMHHYISIKKEICGGRSIIEGTRIPVWSIIKWYKLGMSFEEIMREFPHLNPAQIHDAFSYYYDNQEEIERDILDNENETHYREMSAK